MRHPPWRAPAWFEFPAQRIRFERELAGRGSRPRHARRNRQYSGGYQITVTVSPPGVASREVTIIFSRHSPDEPRVYTDGPTESPHRYGDEALCMWHPFDPPERKWIRRDGAAALLGHIVAHLIREEWWRRTGEWVGPEAPHDPIVGEITSSGRPGNKGPASRSAG